MIEDKDLQDNIKAGRNMSAENKEQVEDAQKHTGNIDFLVDPNKFSTPTMGDFYLGAVDGVYLKKIDELANTKDGKGNEKDAAFYTENPPVKKMGETDTAFYLKAKVNISEDDIDQGYTDGRTLNLNIDDISGDEKAVANLKQQLLDTMQKYGSMNDNATGNTYLTIRLVGLGCPATPKWAFEYGYKNSALNQQKRKIADISNSSMYLYVSGLHDEEEELNFVKIGGKWREATFYSQDAETSSFRWLMDPGDVAYDKAMQAAKNLRDLIAKNGNEIYFLMDKEGISTDSKMSSASMGNAVMDASVMGELSYSVKNAPGGCAYKTGYARTHQEAYRRFSGVAYVKADGKFCNLAMMALTDKTNEELYADNRYDGKNREMYAPQRYDQDKRNYADAYFKVLSEVDDRKKIQKEIFKKDFKSLNQWTVTIGDVTLFIPPANISCVSTVESDKLPMIRAKGSASKSGHRVTRQLIMEVFFNEERGINGYSHEVELPNKAKIEYKLNGLRQLIAQFKFTPFLPIENDYINKTLGIEAVLFENLSINNVSGYPKLYQAIIRMNEFDFGAYMPELFNFASENNYEGNLFSASINWQVMRYYYQRCIRKGDTLAASGYKFNTKEYNNLMVGNRTTLVPMAFKSSDIKFYLANKDYMDQMLAARMEMLNGSAKPLIDFNKDELAAMKKLGTLSKAIKEAVGSEEFREALISANKNSEGDIHLAFFDSNRTIEDSQRPNKSQSDFYGTGIKHMTENGEDKDKRFDFHINKPVSVIKNYVDAVNETLGEQGYLISDVRLSYETQNSQDGGKDIYIGLSVECSTDYLSDNQNFVDLKQDASNYVGVSKDEFFKDYKIFIPLKAHFEPKEITRSGYKKKWYENTTGFEMDLEGTDMKFLEFCENADDLEKENSEIKKRRSSVNLNQLDSLVYDKYDIGKTYIQTFGASLQNHLSSVSITNISGTSAQYLGGEDTAFEFLIKTTDRDAAAKLCALPKIAAQYARDYHMLLPYYPLRVDSELTAFLGVNEVVIDSAVVKTGNDETGVYTVQLVMHSVDRTLRDREAMERTELNNGGYNRGDSRIKNHIRTFFEIQDILNQAELYPDLELPTLKEMNKVGYEYIRYKFQDNRKYVDPDFYFIYPQVLMSQTIRELVVNGHQNGLGSSTLTDKTGASIDITPAEAKGVEYSGGNEQFQEQQEKIKKAENAAEAQKKKRKEENLLKDEDANILAKGEHEQWAVCKDITPMFLEKKYRKECIAYEAYKKANDEKKNTEDAKEGEWVSGKLQQAAEASSLIMQYLTENGINDSIGDRTRRIDPNELTIQGGLKLFLGNGNVQEIFSKINIKHTDSEFQDVFKDLVFAAACSATGEKEYAGKKNQADWKPDRTYIAYINRNEGQEVNGSDLAKTVDEGVENGVRFGCYNIRMYSRSEMLKLTCEDIEAKDGDSVNEKMYLLDPYYRSDPDRIREYKRGCIISPRYATIAFLRIMLYWLSRLIDEKAIPTITNDVLRDTVNNELKIQMKQAAKGAADKSPSVVALNSNINFFNKRTYAIDAGKIFTGMIMALTDGNGTVMGHIKTNNYKALNAYIQSCANPSTKVSTQEKSVMATRKMMLALIGVGRIDDMDAIGSSPVNPATNCYQSMAERKYIAAAEDPAQYIPHSCHDMIVGDARGRMLRAFPTFYMVFVDEGREIGQWKLHDNFYTTNALLSMEIVKSRKIAADTAIISMSNFYQSYATEADDYRRKTATAVNGTSFGDAIDSIFSPNEYAKKLDQKTHGQPKELRIRIREGARMHIRLGYGSSASMLPIVFNGCVAEVSAEDTVEIVAQGDGIELMNPITDVEEAHELNNEDGVSNWDIFNNSATTKEIMRWLLTRKGGWIGEMAAGTKLEGLINCNPYGLYHFGSPDLKSIHKSGEICQNIFDSWALPIWGDYEEADKQAPEINIQMFQKTVWDVANICKSVMPDFICAVAPFSFRSTLFIGDPRFYYAYDYDNASGALIEKRKPYQQYHIYTSYSDIIGNGMRASSKKMKTNAIGLYEVDFGTGSLQSKTTPIMADIDIYPEYQKTMVVDTRLFAKSIPLVSGILAPLADFADQRLGTVDDKGSMVNNTKLAKSMALSALLDSMRDMYCGDIVVMGDGTVKPHDRIYINDTHEGFKGQATVKEVVHSFNVNDGFTTSISPDCIVKADPKYELGANNMFNTIGSMATAVMGVAAYSIAAKALGAVPNLKDAFSAFKESKWGGKVKEGLESTKEGAKKLAEKAAEKSPLAKKGITKGAEAAKKGAEIAKDIKRTKTALKASLASTGFGLALVVAETAISYAIAESINSMITDKIRSMNAVKVFPVERFCMPYTAGLAGSKGLIISEHVKDGGGGIKAALASLIPEDSLIFNTMMGLFLTDEAAALINKMKRDNGIIDSSGAPTESNDAYAQKYLHSVGKTMDEKDYRAMTITPRVDLGKAMEYASSNNLSEEQTTERDKIAADISSAYNKYAMLDTTRWFVDPKLQFNVSISDDARLKPYAEEDFFYVIHEQPTLNKQKDKVITQVVTTSSGEEDYVKAIVDQGQNGEIYDIPMLNPDAVNVLYEIIRRAKNRMPAAKSSDTAEAHEKGRGSYVVLKSALRIGDKTSYSPTGFSFILQGTGDAYDAIIKAAEELTQEVKEDSEKSEGLTNPTIFSFDKKQGASNKEVLFTVHPPKVTTANTKESTAGE